MAEITEDFLLEQKEALKLFNDAMNGKVNSMELGRLLKSLGDFIPNYQIRNLKFRNESK